MASLQTNNGYYRIKYRDIDNKWKIRHLGKIGIISKQEAKQTLQQYQTIQNNQKLNLRFEVPNLAVLDLLDTFLAFRRSSPNKRASTIKNYSSFNNALQGWFNQYNLKKIDQITNSFLETFNEYFFENRKLGKSHVKNIQTYFRNFLDWSIKRGYYNNTGYTDFIENIQRDEPDPRFFSLAELETIFKNGNSFTPIYQFLTYTGLRIGELTALKWEDIIINDANEYILIIRQPKSRKKSVQSIVLNDKAIKIINKMRLITGLHEYVFEYNGRKILDNTIRYHFNKLRTKYDIKKAKIHTFRHTFASQLAIAGVSLGKIKELMRHANIHETMIYAHVSTQSLKEATNSFPNIPGF